MVDWFNPPNRDHGGHVAREDAAMATVLMLGTTTAQRIDGTGIARRALEAAPTGDGRQDLDDGERARLAVARAWCLLVHGDLGHGGRRDDQFILADAERNLDLAQEPGTDDPQLLTALALLRVRQGRMTEAVELSGRTLEAFGSASDTRREGPSRSGVVEAILVWALASAVAGQRELARSLCAAARAVRDPVDLDEAAFGSLSAEVDEIVAAPS